MYDMQMAYCTRMYNTDLEEYIALGRTMRIFRNTLHSDVQCGFLKECIALGRTMRIFGIHCTRTYNADFFDLNIILERII